MITTILSIFLFSIALYFANVNYSITIMEESFETKRNRYKPNEIKEIIYYRKSGQVWIKLHGTFEAKKLKFRRDCLPDAMQEMVNWAIKNDVKYRD